MAAGVKAEVGKASLKKDKVTWGDVTGIIGLAGYQANGNMIISFDEKAIILIVNAMLGESYTKINDEIVDAVGELTNMISGGAKRTFNEVGYFFEMATPLTVVGKNLEIKQLTNDPVITVPFVCGEGAFVLEASLSNDRGE